MTWEEILEDEKWEGISDKIELDENGKIILVPMSDETKKIQLKYMNLLIDNLSDNGQVMLECAIALGKSVISPDIAFASDEFVEKHEIENPFTKAPELCIEIVKESVSQEALDKRVRNFLELGAKEVWTINPEDKVQVYDQSGLKEKSSYNLEFA